MTTASSDVAEEISEIVREVIGAERVELGQRLVEDMGYDSVQILELIVRIDERFGVDLGIALSEGVPLDTLADVIREIGETGEPAPRPPAPAPARPRALEPLFFEHDGRRLYGVLHRPTYATTTARGVVVCNPFANEAYQAHRALRHLGLTLASRGVPTLRFEYHGTGDSDDSLWEARVPSWIASVGAAARVLRERTGVGAVSVVGLRLGATLAALAGEALDGVDELVLWNPVIEGAPYVDGLRRLDRRSFPRRSDRRGRENELLGAVVHPELLEGIAALDLRAAAGLPSRVLVVDGSRRRRAQALEQEAWVSRYEARDERWQWNAFFSSLFWPLPTIRFLVDHLAGEEG